MNNDNSHLLIFSFSHSLSNMTICGRYDGAKAVVEQAVSVPASCDAMPGLPLSKENDGFSSIALLSEAVVSYLAN
jgi:hypothetical protein